MIDGPSVVIGEYPESKLNLLPRNFNITSRLVIGSPSTGCKSFINSKQLRGNIVLVTEGNVVNLIQIFYNREGGNCPPREKQRRIHESGGIGMIMVSVGIGKGGFGTKFM